MNRTRLPNPALEQLQRVLSVTPERMFGCIGVYSSNTFFAIIDGERVYFKVDELNRSTYEARGMGPFNPYGNGKQVASFYKSPLTFSRSRKHSAPDRGASGYLHAAVFAEPRLWIELAGRRGG